MKAHSLPGLGYAGRRPNQRGFSLIELVMVIAILAVSTLGVMSALRINVLSLNDTASASVATRLAQERMELILGNKRALGFATLADPCPTAAVCVAAPANYGVTSTIGPIAANARTINVRVTFNGALRAELDARVTNY